MRFGFTGLCLLIFSSTALAQEPPPTYVEGAVNGTQSVLPNMLSTQVNGTFDARIDYTHFNENNADATILGFSLHGQWITPGGLGGYASIPFGYISADGNSENGVGNVELGGLYAIRQPNMDVLLRGGVALDTTSDEDVFLVLASQLSPRLNDAYTTSLNTTWGRAQGQLRYSSGTLRLGASGGFDIPIDGDLSDSDNFDGLVNLAVSLGIEQPGFGVGVGFVFIHALTDTDDDDNDVSGFNATIDFPIGPKARLFAALGIPDLDNVQDNGADLFAIGAGVRIGM
jgi:hypothetical protein